MNILCLLLYVVYEIAATMTVVQIPIIMWFAYYFTNRHTLINYHTQHYIASQLISTDA